jgi:hypothetical protein
MRFPLLLCILPILAAQGRAEDLVLKIPPAKSSFDIKGQAVTLTAWGTVSGASQGPFKVALTADLSDLQDHIGPLLASQLDRSDRCGERISVENATLDSKAVLIAHVHYERWACAKVLGREMVKRLVGGHAAFTVMLKPSVGVDGIAMASEVTDIQADGSLGEVLKSDSLGKTLKDKIASSIESSIRKGLDLKSTLPPAMAAAVTLRSAHFMSSPLGRLWFSVEGEVHVSAAQLKNVGLRYNGS